jgi:hypothetical protein
MAAKTAIGCDQCEMVAINGVACHEQGCPSSHVGTVRECFECGCEFEPESRFSRYCSDECAIMATV